MEDLEVQALAEGRPLPGRAVPHFSDEANQTAPHLRTRGTAASFARPTGWHWAGENRPATAFADRVVPLISPRHGCQAPTPSMDPGRFDPVHTAHPLYSAARMDMADRGSDIRAPSLPAKWSSYRCTDGHPVGRVMPR
jgi:hypothetical protein